MLVMSDVSGPGVGSEGISYLTGYPLPDAGMYAIATSWPAPEMPRPGCVWTHTFFLGFADLASIDAPSRIAHHFARPTADGLARYGTAVQIDFEGPDGTAMNRAELEWLGRVLNALYEKPDERVLARRDPSVDVEPIVLRAWDQQWPRLRRSFRFCTLTTTDRSVDGAAFDLQVAPVSEAGSRARIPRTLEATEVPLSSGDWLDSLIADIQQPNASGLRDSLRMLGADILGSRGSMRMLCEFRDITTRESNASAIDAAVSLVSEPHSLSGSQFAKAQVAMQVLRRVAEVGDASLQFLIDHLSVVDPAELTARTQDVALTLWQRDPPKLLALLHDESGRSFATRAIRELPIAVLLDRLPNGDDGKTLKILLGARPDLIETALFWSTTQISPLAVAATGADLSEGKAVSAMLKGLHQESAITLGVEAAGALNVLNGIQESWSIGKAEGSLPLWVRYACADNSIVATFLSRISQPSGGLLELIADVIPPDAVPNDFGHDPWFNALQQSSSTLTPRLLSYGLSRALGWRSRSAGELLRLTFDKVYELVGSATLDDTSWSLIEGKLPWSPADQWWDRCLRLRQAVAKAFVSRHLSPKDFAWVATSSTVFVPLMEEAYEQWGGRRFLREVEDALHLETGSEDARRRALVHSFLGSRKGWW